MREERAVEADAPAFGLAGEPVLFVCGAIVLRARGRWQAWKVRSMGRANTPANSPGLSRQLPFRPTNRIHGNLVLIGQEQPTNHPMQFWLREL